MSIELGHFGSLIQIRDHSIGHCRGPTAEEPEDDFDYDYDDEGDTDVKEVEPQQEAAILFKSEILFYSFHHWMSLDVMVPKAVDVKLLGPTAVAFVQDNSRREKSRDSRGCPGMPVRCEDICRTWIN